ncbi:MAG: NAD-dependent epimerase/dehydratase family protein, partial [Halobacteriaceae archaeon]
MELSGRDIVITGGGGFIGSHLAEELRGDNTVRVVDRFSNSSPDWVPDGVELIEGDLRDQSVVAEAITNDIDLVFH